jgi:hypothetical protein
VAIVLGEGEQDVKPVAAHVLASWVVQLY